MTYTIDATGKSIGRVASEAAKLLMGKNTASFTKHIQTDVTVIIEHASNVVVSDKKKRMKLYSSYSGYQGGLTQRSLGHVIEKRGMREALKHAVRGMLPNNKLRPGRLKRLTIKD